MAQLGEPRNVNKQLSVLSELDKRVSSVVYLQLFKIRNYPQVNLNIFIMILFFLYRCFLPPRETDMFNYAYILDCVEKDTLLPNLLDYRCVIGCTDGSMAQHAFSGYAAFFSSGRGCLEQWCGTGSAWIRILLKSRIRISINLRMKSQKCM